MHKIIYGFLILVFLFIGGCSTYSRKDGPPSYSVDVSKIPDATPKVEAYSKYGNYSTYRVFGRNYHVMKSSKNYVAEGTASWYGTKFHRQRTSSGEPYDMLAMTAAHKTLPLPTYVEVTNLANNRKVIVKVNDRGPFEGNRLIDLSYTAAKKLGMMGRGTAHVRVVAIDPIEFAKTGTVACPAPLYAQNNRSYRQIPPARPITTHRQFAENNHLSTPKSQAIYLQVGAFRNPQSAERLKNRLAASMGHPVYITPTTRATNKLYRVQIGPIDNITAADHVAKKLQSIGIKSRRI